MKVILREEVAGLGAPGAVVEVAPGYARNYLLPRKLAIEATRGNLRNLDQVQRMVQRRQNRLAQSASGIANRLGEINLVMRARSGEDGRLYGSVTTTDISEALQERFEMEVDKRKIEIPEPIRVVGSHEVKVRLHPEVEATLTVTVEPEDEAQRERMQAAAQARAAEAVVEQPATEQPPAEAAGEQPAPEQPPAEAADEQPAPEQPPAEAADEQPAPEPVVDEQPAAEAAEVAVEEAPSEEQATPETES
jgi:large subunit ribosomal protein L9